MRGDESAARFFAKQTTDKDNYKCKSFDSLGNMQLNMHLQASPLKVNGDANIVSGVSNNRKQLNV